MHLHFLWLFPAVRQDCFISQWTSLCQGKHYGAEDFFSARGEVKGTYTAQGYCRKNKRCAECVSRLWPPTCNDHLMDVASLRSNVCRTTGRVEGSRVVGHYALPGCLSLYCKKKTLTEVYLLTCTTPARIRGVSISYCWLWGLFLKKKTTTKHQNYKIFKSDDAFDLFIYLFKKKTNLLRHHNKKRCELVHNMGSQMSLKKPSNFFRDFFRHQGITITTALLWLGSSHPRLSDTTTLHAPIASHPDTKGMA